MPVTVSIMVQPVPPAAAEHPFTVSGETLQDCAGAARSYVSRNRRIITGKSGFDEDPHNRGYPFTVKVTGVTGAPDYLHAAINRCLPLFVRSGPIPVVSDEIWWADRVLALSPLLDEAARAGSGEARPGQALKAALGSLEFQKACRTAGIDMPGLARAAAAGSSSDADAVLEGWEESLFPKLATTGMSVADAARLHETMRALSGEDGNGGTHEFTGGACGIWAAVLDGVLEAGGSFVVLANPRFKPERATGCTHIAVRAGNWIVDGQGASRIAPFLKRWGCGWEDIHEVDGVSGRSLIGHMHNEKALKLLDPDVLAGDMRALGLGAGIVLRDGPGGAPRLG